MIIDHGAEEEEEGMDDHGVDCGDGCDDDNDHNGDANGKWQDGGDMAVMLDLLMATSNNITVQVDGWKTSGCNAPHDKCSTICNNILRLEG